MIHDLERLRRTLGHPMLARLLQALTDRLRLGRALTGSLTLSNPSGSERSAIDQLLGRKPSSGTSLTLRLSEIERVLRQGDLCDSLEEAVHVIAGPVTNQRATRESAQQRWSDLFISAEFAIADAAELLPWLHHIRATGLLKRLTRGDLAVATALIEKAIVVLRQLPQPVVPLAEFSARVAGDSHALDVGTPLSTLCLSAIAMQQGLPPSRSADFRRERWDFVGVVVDELCAPVLVLNLRGDPSTLVGRLLNVMAAAGEPCHLTVRQLRAAGENAFGELREIPVHVCENPSVIAAAAQRLGARSLPLICTSGQPASAAQLLLRQLREAGCRILYHGDMDRAGIGIANFLVQRFSVEPWRMSAPDYLSAVSTTGLPLRGRPAVAGWDAELSASMRSHGKAVLEECVVDVLISDLIQPSGR